jgi:type I restriction enzyme, S subunit
VRSWRNVKLGEVAEFINGDRGNNYPTQGDFCEEGVPFINAGHLKNGEIDFSDMNFIKESRFNLLGNGKTRLNDILYCLRGSLGKTAIVLYDGNAAIASSLVIIRPSQDLYFGYLYHFLTSPFGQVEIRKFDNGSSQPNLSANSVKNYLVPLPPLAEQRRIADVLDRAETLRTKRRAALAQLDPLTQSIFVDLFGDPTTNPKGWNVKQLEELCHSITDIDHKMPKDVQKGIPFVSAKDLTDDGRISFEQVKQISEEDFRRLSRKSKPEKGDIIYSRIGVNLGKARVVQVEFPFLASYSCCTIKPKRELVDLNYLCVLLDSPFMLRQAHRGVRAIAVPDLGIGEIKAFKIVLPPITLQREFARRVAAVEKLKTAQRTSLAEFDNLFAALQHRAFRGEL